MPFRSRTTDKTSPDLLADTLTNEEPIVAGRLEWVTTVTREQLADVDTRSKTLAGTARTRVTPLTDASRRRFRPSSEPPAVPEPEPSTSSTPWLLIALVSAIVSVIVFIAARRAQTRSEAELFEHPVQMDRLTESDMLAVGELPMHHDRGNDGVAANPS